MADHLARGSSLGALAAARILERATKMSATVITSPSSPSSPACPSKRASAQTEEERDDTKKREMTKMDTNEGDDTVNRNMQILNHTGLEGTSGRGEHATYDDHGPSISGRGRGMQNNSYERQQKSTMCLDSSMANATFDGASGKLGIGKRNSAKKGGNQGVDIKQYRKRYVALELMYIGWNFHGFAAQLSSNSTSDNGRIQNKHSDCVPEISTSKSKFLQNGAELHRTVEGVLLSALQHTRLIDDDADSLRSIKYSRCGRTDKGVSALGQVVALKLRSRQLLEPKTNGFGESVDMNINNNTSVEDRDCRMDVENEEEEKDDVDDVASVELAPTIPSETEIDYVGVLNKALPAEVRVLGWSDVPNNFDARFSCSWRQYKYFFAVNSSDCQLGGSFRIEAMRAAAKLLEGEHDFRNFCKMDVENVQSFRRTILMVNIEEEGPPGSGLYSFNIRGQAFLYNQVRCLMAVLMMVGKGQEEPDIVSTLLDVENTPRKPPYVIADPENLILYKVGYNSFNLAWRRPQNATLSTLGMFVEAQRSILLRNAMFNSCHSLISSYDTVGPKKDNPKSIHPLAVQDSMKMRATVTSASVGGSGEKHIPLLQRSAELSLEEKRRRFREKDNAKKEKCDTGGELGSERNMST